MRSFVALLCVVAIGALIVLADDPVPSCTQHIDTAQTGSCTDCPDEEHPEYCTSQLSLYDYWCPANGACDEGYHCADSAEQKLKISAIEYGCINACSDPNDPHCRYNLGDVVVWYAWFPEECVCMQDA